MIDIGIYFARDYSAIVEELSVKLMAVEECHRFIMMEKAEWQDLGEHEKKGFLKTMADDVIYALGVRHHLRVGKSTVTYDRNKQWIKVQEDRNVTHVVPLA